LMARHPSRISAAVLCATFAAAPLRTLTRLTRFLPTAAFSIRSAAQCALTTFCLNDTNDPALLDEASAVVASVSASAIRSRLAILASLETRRLLGRIHHPVIILEATRDRLLNEHRRRELREFLPQAAVHRIDGPHLLLQARPAECAAAIAKFRGDELSAVSA
jgi:pimeloyl-[acyl-carrier protein] methyl ester esterase